MSKELHEGPWQPAAVHLSIIAARQKLTAPVSSIQPPPYSDS